MKINPADRKTITAHAKTLGYGKRIRLEITKRFSDDLEESTYNIHGVHHGDIDDSYAYGLTVEEFNKMSADDRRCDLPVVVLDIMVAYASGFGSHLEWDCGEYINPRFENGRLAGFN